MRPTPVVITIYADKSFTFETKLPPVTYFIKKADEPEVRLQASGQGIRRHDHRRSRSARSPKRR